LTNETGHGDLEVPDLVTERAIQDGEKQSRVSGLDFASILYVSFSILMLLNLLTFFGLLHF